MIEIELPDKGVTLEFPDTTPKWQIKNAIDREFYSPRISAETSAPSLLQRGMNIAERGLKATGIVPEEFERRISPEAGARSLVMHQAREEGVPLSEYREAPELIEQAAQGFVSGATAGLIPGIERETTGLDEIPATSTSGNVGRGLGQLGGFVVGPAKVGHGLIKPVLPATAPTSILGATAREAATLAPAFAVSATGEALQKQTWGDAVMDITKAGGRGAVVGSVFGFSKGLFPKDIEQRAARIVTGLVGLNAMRAAEGQGFIPVNRPLDEVVFDTAMDVFFLWKGMGPKGFERIEKAINEGKPYEIDPVLQAAAEKNQAEINKTFAREAAQGEIDRIFPPEVRKNPSAVKKVITPEEVQTRTPEELEAARKKYGFPKPIWDEGLARIADQLEVMPPEWAPRALPPGQGFTAKQAPFGPATTAIPRPGPLTGRVAPDRQFKPEPPLKLPPSRFRAAAPGGTVVAPTEFSKPKPVSRPAEKPIDREVLMRKFPKEEPRPAPEIPKFKDTEEALEYGKQRRGDPKAIQSLRDAYERGVREVQRLKSEGSLEDAFVLGQENQFYREAAEVAEGRDVELPKRPPLSLVQQPAVKPSVPKSEEEAGRIRAEEELGQKSIGGIKGRQTGFKVAFGNRGKKGYSGEKVKQGSILPPGPGKKSVSLKDMEEARFGQALLKSQKKEPKKPPPPSKKAPGALPRLSKGQEKGVENLPGRIRKMGGLKLDPRDYNIKELKEFPGLKNLVKSTKARTGRNLDDVFSELQAEFPELRTADDLIEALKSGEAKKMYTSKGLTKAEEKWRKAEEQSVDEIEAEAQEQLRKEAEEAEQHAAAQDLEDFFTEKAKEPKVKKKPSGAKAEPAEQKPAQKAAGRPMRVYIGNKVVPAKFVREIKKGKKAGHVEVEVRGKKKIIPKSDIFISSNGPNLEFLGFQTMYERTVRAIKNRRLRKKQAEHRRTKGKKPAVVGTLPSDKYWKDLESGKVIKHRKKGKDPLTGEDLYAPPMYSGEKAILEKAGSPEESRTEHFFGIKNANRTFDQLGQDLKELTYWRVKDADHDAVLERKILDKEIKAIIRGLSDRQLEKVGLYGIAKNKGGLQRLKASGISKDQIPTSLNEQEMKVYNWARQKFDDWYERANNARRLSGKTSFPKVDNYITFMSDTPMLSKLGFNFIDHKDPQFIHAEYLKLITTPFKYAKKRSRVARYPMEVNIESIVRRYANTVIPHIHRSPAIAKCREMLNKFEDGWKMEDKNPAAHIFLTKWLNLQAGQRPFQTPLDPLFMKINENLAFAVLSGNVRSALIQPTAYLHTCVEVGPVYGAKGAEMIANPKTCLKAFKDAAEQSKVLLGRIYDVSVEDAIGRLKAGKIGKAKQLVGKGALIPLQKLDYVTAVATWHSAKLYGLEQLGLSERRARRYADDVVIRTQASASTTDIAPVQRSAAGKTLSLFNTFVINEWNWIKNDVLQTPLAGKTYREARKEKGVLPSAKEAVYDTGTMKKTLGLIVGATLVNVIYEDFIGLTSPYPSPVRAFRDALEEGETIPSATLRAGRELAELVPIIGGAARYGSSPFGAAAQFGQELFERTSNKPLAKPWLVVAGKAIGAPGTMQLFKSHKIRKKGGSLMDAILGSWPEEQGTQAKRRTRPARPERKPRTRARNR